MSRQLALPLRSLPPSRAGYVHALPWGLPLHHLKGQSTPLPRITTDKYGYPRVEPQETRDLPRPPEENIHREVLRACALASALLLLFVVVLGTAMLVYGARNLFGQVEDPSTEDGGATLVYYRKPSLPRETHGYNNTTQLRW
ncbi:uncharacterized protein [Dermacentor andersoni]|uniref:uncharacterized protein n=1 Tax=Dermacentor andersoni TaxID=34620 RepID=UPI003B3AD3A4